MTASLPPQTMNAAAPPAPTPPIAEPEPERRRRRKAFVLLFLLGLLAILLLLFFWYLIFRQPINPIPAIPVSQVPTYSTSIYGATRPIGLAVSPSGDRIYITEGAPKGDALVMDGGGKVLATINPPDTATDHEFVYAAVQPATNEVYISDRPAGKIYIYSRDGAYEREFVPADPIGGWQPVGIAFDPSGQLLVTDLSGPFEKVLVFDQNNRIVRTLGEAEQLNFPNGVAADKSGNVYVTDSNNGRLISFGADGKSAIRVGRGAGKGNLGLPRGLAIDGSGRIFTVDTTAQEVLIYRVPAKTDGPVDFLGSFGTPGISDGQFSFPNSLAIDTHGRVYVTDTFNDRVQVWSY